MRICAQAFHLDDSASKIRCKDILDYQDDHAITGPATGLWRLRVHVCVWVSVSAARGCNAGCQGPMRKEERGQGDM